MVGGDSLLNFIQNYSFSMKPQGVKRYSCAHFKPFCLIPNKILAIFEWLKSPL